jgi:glutamyl-tRNA reductase
MKPNPNESYESWAGRVRMFEHGNALQDIAQGKDIEQVMERMSRRIMDKLMHPLYNAIRESIKTSDLEESKRSYKEKYLDHNAPKADQVEGQIFDKND